MDIRAQNTTRYIIIYIWVELVGHIRGRVSVAPADTGGTLSVDTRPYGCFIFFLADYVVNVIKVENIIAFLSLKVILTYSYISIFPELWLSS